MSDTDDTITIRISTEDSPEEIRAKMGDTTPEQRASLLARIQDKQREIKSALDVLVKEGDVLIDGYEALDRVADVIENFTTLTSKLN